MITARAKLVLATILAVAGLLLWSQGIALGILGLPLGAALLIWHIRVGGVGEAFAAFKSGDYAGVRRAVRTTWWPGALSKQNLAYQNWMEGVALVADCRFPQAREKLLEASCGEIQTENDRSLIQCLLAEVALQMDDLKSAHTHLDFARRLEHQQKVGEVIASGEARLRARYAEIEASVTHDISVPH